MGKAPLLENLQVRIRLLAIGGRDGRPVKKGRTTEGETRSNNEETKERDLGEWEGESEREKKWWGFKYWVAQQTPTCSRTHLVHKIDPSVPGCDALPPKKKSKKDGE